MEIELSNKMNIKENFTFSWKFKNFSLWPGIDGDYIKSPEFTIKCLENSKWCLWFFHKKYSQTCCKLQSVAPYSHNVELSVKFEIVNVRNEIYASRIIESILAADISKQAKYIRQDSIVSEIYNSPGDVFNIVCHLRKKDKIENVHVKCEAVTNFKANQYVAIWNIGQCIALNFKSEPSEFPLIDCPFRLRFKSDDGYVSIEIRTKDTNSVVPLLVKGTILLLDNMKIKEKSKFHSQAFQSPRDIWKFPNFISKEELDPTKYIKFTFMVATGKVEHTIKEYTYQNFETKECVPNKVPKNLQNDLFAMFTSKKNSDVKVKVGEELIDAHKFILAARSPVFCSMFDQDMLESRSGIIDLSNLDIDTVKDLVHYMYSDCVIKGDFKRSFNLLMAAHKYQILRLVDACANFLSSFLEVDNVLEVVTAADLIEHEFLKTVAINFIITNAKTILSMSIWKTWIRNNAELGSEIVCKLSIEIEKIFKRL